MFLYFVILYKHSLLNLKEATGGNSDAVETMSWYKGRSY
jgi:hypothetical protein